MHLGTRVIGLACVNKANLKEANSEWLLMLKELA